MLEVSCRFKCKDSSQWFWEDFQCVSFFFFPRIWKYLHLWPLWCYLQTWNDKGGVFQICGKWLVLKCTWKTFFFFCLPQKLVWWPMALSQGGLVMTDIIETSFKTFQRTFWMVLYKWCWLLVHIDPYDLWPWDLCRNRVSIRGVREFV